MLLLIQLLVKLVVSLIMEIAAQVQCTLMKILYRDADGVITMQTKLVIMKEKAIDHVVVVVQVAGNVIILGIVAIVIHQDLGENMNTVEEHHIILAVRAKIVTLEGLLVQRNTVLPKPPHQIHLDHIEAVGDEVTVIDLVETEAVREIVVGIEVNVEIMNGQFALLDKVIIVRRVVKNNLPHQDLLLLQINKQLSNLILFRLPPLQQPTLPPPWELQTPVVKLLDKPLISSERFCCTVQLYFK